MHKDTESWVFFINQDNPAAIFKYGNNWCGSRSAAPLNMEQALSLAIIPTISRSLHLECSVLLMVFEQVLSLFS